MNKIVRQNTQDQPIAKAPPLIAPKPVKKNRIAKAPRVSMSNYSIMSIQKDMHTSINKMNALIAKSPTITRNQRKSSFMNRLPEVLKSIVNASQNVTQRASIFSVKQNEEDKSNLNSNTKVLNEITENDNTLSEIKSEESFESKHEETPSLRKNDEPKMTKAQ